MSIACVSGYFDPIHIGHIEYFKLAKQNADKLMVIVNNDEQAILKKGRAFMPADERIKIIQELKCVDFVVKSVDLDRTVCKTLSVASPRPTFFCNGGDQNNNSIPEAAICLELGIELVDGLGDKIQSSSWLIKGANLA
jgi:cytidyltransferase-like protein